MDDFTLPSKPTTRKQTAYSESAVNQDTLGIGGGVLCVFEVGDLSVIADRVCIWGAFGRERWTV